MDWIVIIITSITIVIINISRSTSQY